MLVEDVHPSLASYFIGQAILHSPLGYLPGRLWTLHHLCYAADHVLLEHPSHGHLFLHQFLMEGVGLADDLREIVRLEVISESVCVCIGCD